MEVTKASPDLVVFTIGGRRFEMNEMKIKRMKELARLLFLSQKEIMDRYSNRDPQETLADDDLIYMSQKVVEILNFLLTSDHPIDLEFYEANLSYREIEEIVSEAVEQSRVRWLRPFFEPFFQIVAEFIPMKMRMEVG